MKKVLILGGAGYIGSMLTKKLLSFGFQVTVLDIMLYGNHLKKHPFLKIVIGDIRNTEFLKSEISKYNYVIHLINIDDNTNNSFFERIKTDVNVGAFHNLVKIINKSSVKMFIYLSSTSVYGKQGDFLINENTHPNPLSEYAFQKLKCESFIKNMTNNNISKIIVRSSTVCGFSYRQRFDLSINFLTNYIYNTNYVPISSPDSFRPNVNIDTLIDFFICLLNSDKFFMNTETFNISYENIQMIKIAEIIMNELQKKVHIIEGLTKDERSYKIDCSKIKEYFNFFPSKNMKNAVQEVLAAFKDGYYNNSLTNELYYNRPLYIKK